ncbi:hypothetical protein [Portibacter marinus]|uniref:hypothetical protein n=1 Tax=Portibacter marinus TaxID=2898660 RepID=UPI001F415789|nr:hypothetical protein [Portibacter marinus]
MIHHVSSHSLTIPDDPENLMHRYSNLVRKVLIDDQYIIYMIDEEKVTAKLEMFLELMNRLNNRL